MPKLSKNYLEKAFHYKAMDFLMKNQFKTEISQINGKLSWSPQFEKKVEIRAQSWK